MAPGVTGGPLPPWARCHRQTEDTTLFPALTTVYKTRRPTVYPDDYPSLLGIAIQAYHDRIACTGGRLEIQLASGGCRSKAP